MEGEAFLSGCLSQPRQEAFPGDVGDIAQCGEEQSARAVQGLTLKMASGGSSEATEATTLRLSHLASYSLWEWTKSEHHIYAYTRRGAV
jgi:hypothetical protein